MRFEQAITLEGVSLTPKKDAGLLHRFLRRNALLDIKSLTDSDRYLAYALADARSVADEMGEAIAIDSDRIFLSHRVVAALSQSACDVLGLPSLVDLTFKTDAEGIVGSSGFRLRYEWLRNGVRQLPSRIGAVLQTSEGLRRLPIWMLEAIQLADQHAQNRGSIDDWEALARFRKALDPGAASVNSGPEARISISDFLSGLEVTLADTFSISPRSDSDFDVVPFSSKTLDRGGNDIETIDEDMSEIQGGDLDRFQSLVKGRGALPAYRLSPGKYLVIDRSAAPALEAMAEMQRASVSDRREFIRNPLPKLTEAFDKHLRTSGKLDGLTSAAEEEVIEAALLPAFTETREFSERVTGIVKFEKPVLEEFGPSETTWLPEDFSRQISEFLSGRTKEELSQLREQLTDALARDQVQVEVGDLALPARPEMLRLIDEKIAQTESNKVEIEAHSSGMDKGPYVLDTQVNFDDLKWHASLKPRQVPVSTELPSGIRTPLKPHQITCFNWQVDAWRAGLPGILNADEQGLGKTLQTIAFLAWIKSVTALPSTRRRGPILVVAPTSLLQNWEQEVQNHLDEDGLGHLIRLYGSSLAGRKVTGSRGKDIDDATAKLDLRMLQEAVAEGRAHRFWLLTTYTTLTNYQHSLARIPFSVAVFDEIQALKNPVSLRAAAARSVNADFRIGLTGTPIENSTVDLWAVIDQLAAGSLGSLKEFRQSYTTPDESNMAELYARVFEPHDAVPPLAIRRLKDNVAKDLPAKSRRLHPRLMPAVQEAAYDDARLKLASGGLGAQLKMLHHIRSVSVHPLLDGKMDDSEFVSMSGRLDATIEILRRVCQNGERALVFIEHRQMQYRFIELVKRAFGLGTVDLINGDTPIPQRQAIVNRFQRHLQSDGGFDVLVLGPKAAGTGLTLTAATHVIHLSRWWNPAVEEQCNDRVHRIGQKNTVTIHVPMAIHAGYREHSFDCLLQSLMMRKRRLASAALWPMGDTQEDIAELQRLLGSDRSSSVGEPVSAALRAMFARDHQLLPPPASDGSYAFQ